jgi:glycosyltransferase involved in cell wall biosynthesis
MGLRTVVSEMSTLGVPIVADCNEWWLPFSGAGALLAPDQALFRWACEPKLSGIMGISHFWEDYSRAIGKPFIKIPALFDFGLVRPTQTVETCFTLVYAGMLFRRDLPEALIQGIRLALNRGCNLKVVLVGRTGVFPESRRAMRSIMRDPRLSSNCSVTGWVSGQEMGRIFERASAFVLLRDDSLEARASFPTRIPEYLASGRPVITSATYDLAGYLDHKRSAWLLPPGHQPEPLAEAIVALASDREMAKRIGSAGVAIAEQEFSLLGHGRRLKAFLDSLEFRPN